MERRRLLLLAATGLGLAAAPGGRAEATRELLDMTLQPPRALEDWHIACADHLHAIRTRPAAQVHDDLLTDLVVIQQQMTTARAAEALELQRVTATLSAYHAGVLTRLGEVGPALRWYRTARGAAEVSGDMGLLLRIAGNEANFSQFGLRDPATNLRVIDNALKRVGDAPRPSAGLALLTGVRSITLALLGRKEEARTAVQRLLDMSERGVPTVEGIWDTAEHPLNYMCAQAYSCIGDFVRAEEMRQRVLAASGISMGYHVPVNLALYSAMCTVVNGGVEEGIREASAVLDSLRAPYRNTMITKTCRRVLRAVPVEQRKSTAVREFRALLPLDHQPIV
ncbi:hypothetical protein [Spongiactinospora sp. 9N601]|uniref:hypothetical protein n=1 Tax=Spongiactinospora sp. 9N601 TaxID=3375149 RepID=UPI0037B5CE95